MNMTEMMAVVEAIRASFPHLKMELARDYKQVDLRMHIPRQLGLAFDVIVNLRGNELQLADDWHVAQALFALRKEEYAGASERTTRTPISRSHSQKISSAY